MSETKMTKSQLVKRISDLTKIKQSVVKDVLNAFTDVFTEEVVSNGTFHFGKCFTVNSLPRKARRAYNVTTGEYYDYPETNVLSIKLAREINYMYRWSQRHQRNVQNNISVSDFKEKLKKANSKNQKLEELMKK